MATEDEIKAEEEAAAAKAAEEEAAAKAAEEEAAKKAAEDEAAAKAAEEEAAASKGKKGKFQIFDSNGIHIRDAKSEDEAVALCKIYGGKYAKA